MTDSKTNSIVVSYLMCHIYWYMACCE